MHRERSTAVRRAGAGRARSRRAPVGARERRVRRATVCRVLELAQPAVVRDAAQTERAGRAGLGPMRCRVRRVERQRAFAAEVALRAG